MIILISIEIKKMTVTISNSEELIEYFRQFSSNEKGNKFEQICIELLKKKYDDIKKIGIWSKEIGKKDKGIDIYIEHNDGKKSYCQAKYREDSNLTYTDLSTFLSEVTKKENQKDSKYFIVITNTELSRGESLFFINR